MERLDMKFSSHSLMAMACSLAIVGLAAAGPDWTEIPDAGKLTPQLITLPSQPSTIIGELAGLDADGGPDIADTFRLKIDTPTTLVISSAMIPLVGAGATNFDSVLYLFTIDGFGLLANDDISQNNNLSRLLAYSTDGTGVVIPGPGEYILAISYNDVAPGNMAGAIFSQGPGSVGGPFQISGPDGPGGSAPFDRWGGNMNPHPASTYLIQIRPLPPRPPCAGDANGDSVVNFQDITAVLANWQATCP